MMIRNGVWFLIAVACGSFMGCSSSTLEGKVTEFINETGQSFESCGSITVDPMCESPQSAAADCLANGFSECKPVRLDLTIYTIEGDPIYYTYLVVPGNGSCSIEYFVDTREDAFGPQEINQFTCEKLELVESCQSIAVDECIPQCEGGADCG